MSVNEPTKPNPVTESISTFAMTHNYVTNSVQKQTIKCIEDIEIVIFIDNIFNIFASI